MLCFLSSLSKLHATSGVYFRSRTIPFDPFEFCCSDSVVHPKNKRQSSSTMDYTCLIEHLHIVAVPWDVFELYPSKKITIYWNWPTILYMYPWMWSNSNFASIHRTAPFLKLCSDPCWPDSQRERPNDPWTYIKMPQIVTIEINLNISTCCLVHRISNLFSGWAWMGSVVMQDHVFFALVLISSRSGVLVGLWIPAFILACSVQDVTMRMAY